MTKDNIKELMASFTSEWRTISLSMFCKKTGMICDAEAERFYRKIDRLCKSIDDAGPGLIANVFESALLDSDPKPEYSYPTTNLNMVEVRINEIIKFVQAEKINGTGFRNLNSVQEHLEDALARLHEELRKSR